MSARKRARIGCRIPLSLVSFLAPLCFVGMANADVKYGFACQEEFDDPALHDLTTAWDSCTAFHSQMDNIGTRIFYYNLTGNIGPRLLEDSYDGSTGVEDADIVYVETHMGASSNMGAELAGKSWPTVAAFSKNMALGSETNKRGLSILALAGCVALAWHPRTPGDGVTSPYYGVLEDLPTRWSKSFRSGLRMIVGNWDQMWSHKDHGKWFGYYLRNGYTIESAWRMADTKTVSKNDTATAATGTNSSNCWSRLSNMTIFNFAAQSNPRLKGSQVGYYCQHYWSNDSLRDS